MEGICKQTGSFKSECLSIVDQFYVNIYHSLVTNLIDDKACILIEICPKSLNSVAPLGDIIPLLPAVEAAHLNVQITAKPKLAKKKFLGEGEPMLSNKEITEAQLPIDVLLGASNSNQLIDGGRFCLICEYTAHFIQTKLADEKSEAKIKQWMKKMCDDTSSKLHAVCDEFVDNYGDAFIALFIQEIDPSQICPAMFMCASPKKTDVEVMVPLPLEATGDGVTINGGRRYGSEKCPMCLFAVAQAQAAVKSDKSKVYMRFAYCCKCRFYHFLINSFQSNIQLVLKRLCVHLPGKMRMECFDFIETYTNELVTMLADDFTPEAICVQLHLCDPQKPTKPDYLQQIGESNEIGRSRSLYCATCFHYHS